MEEMEYATGAPKQFPSTDPRNHRILIEVLSFWRPDLLPIWMFCGVLDSTPAVSAGISAVALAYGLTALFHNSFAGIPNVPVSCSFHPDRHAVDADGVPSLLSSYSTAAISSSAHYQSVEHLELASVFSLYFFLHEVSPTG